MKNHVNYIAELQWLKHLGDHENMFETGVDRANECDLGGIIGILS